MIKKGKKEEGEEKVGMGSIKSWRGGTFDNPLGSGVV